MENYLYELIMLTVIYKAAHGLPVGFIIFYHTAKNTGFEKRYVKVLTFNFLMDLSIWKSLMQRIHDL